MFVLLLLIRLDELFFIPQRAALRFTDREISWVFGWVTGFTASDIPGLRRPKNVKFGTSVASGMKMMHALSFSKSFFNCGKIGKKRENRPRNIIKTSNIIKRAHSSRATAETTNGRNAEFGTNVAHGLRMMPELFVF